MPFQDRRWYACFTPERHPRNGHQLFDDEASSMKSEESFVFDPKSDGKILQMGPRWDRMPADQTALNRMVGYIKQQPPRGVYGPKLWAILSPDGSTYGYVYIVLTELVIKVIDEKTMLVDNVN